MPFLGLMNSHGIHHNNGFPWSSEILCTTKMLRCYSSWSNKVPVLMKCQAELWRIFTIIQKVLNDRNSTSFSQQSMQFAISTLSFLWTFSLTFQSPTYFCQQSSSHIHSLYRVAKYFLLWKEVANTYSQIQYE